MSVYEETYHALLMEYASGCLDEAHALVVAAHMALSPQARKIVMDYEKIGGAMLQNNCAPVAMKSDALKCVMARLDTCGPAPVKGPCAGKKKLDMSNYHEVPSCLETYIETASWKDARGGYQTMHIRTTCSGSRAEMIKAKPDFSIEQRMMSHAIALVLQGSFEDEHRTYCRGDLIISDLNPADHYHTHSGEGVTYFVVRKSSSPLHRLIQSLFTR